MRDAVDAVGIEFPFVLELGICEHIHYLEPVAEKARLFLDVCVQTVL